MLSGLKYALVEAVSLRVAIYAVLTESAATERRACVNDGQAVARHQFRVSVSSERIDEDAQRCWSPTNHEHVHFLNAPG